MIKNYLLTAMRALRKSKVTAFINISGLAIGMACCLVIFVYVKNELSYDTFHSQADRIFRFYTIDEALGVTSNSVGITQPVMPAAAKAEIPEVLNATRVLSQGRTRITLGRDYVYADDTKSVEPSFFDIFDYSLNTPEAKQAFNQPRKAIMTQAMATKAFGSEDAVGKMLKINDDEWEVVGIIEDVKHHSHLKLDLLLSLYPAQADSSLAQYLDSWQGLGMVGYALLNDAASEATVESKMKELALKNEAPEFWIPQLQPLKDIHLKSSGILFDSYNKNKGDITYVYSLSAVALFVLLIAAFNFMNLSTAQSSSRAKEVGVRKVLGAFRYNLIKQHLGESLLVCILAAIVAVTLVLAVAPYLNLSLSMSIFDFIFTQSDVYLSIISATLVIGLLAGLYPAFILSKFEPVKILRGKFQTSKNGLLLRKVLVIAQFAASITMIIGTILIYEQLQFIKNKSLGFDKDQIVTFQMNDPGLSQNVRTFRDRLLTYETVEGAASSSNMPGRTFGRTGITPEGASENEQNWIVSALSIDEHYLEVLGMSLVAGRNYSPEAGTDQQEAILVNEALVEQVGWTDPVGKKLSLGNNTERTIIGVVKNFHFASMRHSIEPLIMFYNPNVSSNLSVKVKGDIRNTMQSIESEWNAVYPDYPFEYQFFDQEFDNLFKSDESFSRLVSNFTWLAIFIACLGLFGLSAHMAEQRRKEIGVRKVMGSSVSQIVMLLSREFVILIIVATIVAWPLAYIAVKSWLGDFQYRIDLLSMDSVLVFVASGLLALFIGLLTVSYQSIAAAVVNPVRSLRSE
ncbi:putative FtsX-related transmembrane transport protein [Fulvivirga imtechensis AK7]|uniref:Putative FtsX-related transmembrane transport protein n=1 Tax=Fulvivirga imtechensis AK7 TaxID=1237149 RepID=L8JWD8_9BACT|nr:ABC transporter permease [Fulvivirga imtechensis]ELR72518.1 putative FtsX-related transmembrane transport protein [Fulvivirga imtechensis AK7]